MPTVTKKKVLEMCMSNNRTRRQARQPIRQGTLCYIAIFVHTVGKVMPTLPKKQFMEMILPQRRLMFSIAVC